MGSDVVAHWVHWYFKEFFKSPITVIVFLMEPNRSILLNYCELWVEGGNALAESSNEINVIEAIFQRKKLLSSVTSNN